MPIEVRRATTTEDVDQVFRLRFTVYVEEEGKYSPAHFPERRIFDRFDAFDVATNLLGFVDGVPGGFMRISEESILGSPLDDHYQLETIRARCGEFPATVSVLGVRRQFRDRGLAQALMQAGIRHILAAAYTDVIAVVNREISPMLQRMNLIELGEPFFCPRVGQVLVRMWAPAARLPRAEVADPGELNQPGRLVYARGESLFRQGDPGGSAFFITRGRVALSVERPGHPPRLLKVVDSGALLGELEPSPADRRMFTATALGSVEAARVPAAHLMDHLRGQTGTLEQTFSHTTHRLNELLTAMSTPPSGVRLFNEYLTARVLHVLGDLGFFEGLGDHERFRVEPLAQHIGVPVAHLQALCGYMQQVGIFHQEGEEYLLGAAHRSVLQQEYGFIQWLLGAYDPLLDGLKPLIKGEARYGREVRRNDREVALSSAAISKEFTDPFMYEILALDGVATIADIGTGSAIRLIEICKRFPAIRAIGLDLSEDCCRVANENVVRANLTDRIQIIHGRAEEWLIRAHEEGIERVDMVTCFAMFHDLLNVPGLAEQFLADLRRGLRPGSYILIQDQMKLSEGHIGESWVPGFELVHHFMGQKLFPLPVYERAFKQAGLNLLRRVDTPIPANSIFLLQLPLELGRETAAQGLGL